MDRDFERLNRKLEEADIKDISPSFDKNDGWAQLEGRLEEQDRRRVVPLWIKYAAAAVIVLLMGSVGMKLWLGAPDKTTPTIVKQIPASQEPIIINKPIVNETKAIATVQKKPSKEHIKHQDKKPPHRNTSIADKVLDKTIDVVVATEKIIDTVVLEQPEKKEVMVADVPPLKPKVLHLLDINNEDRQTVLNEKETSPSAVDVIIRQSTYTHAMSPNASHQPILLRNMLNK